MRSSSSTTRSRSLASLRVLVLITLAWAAPFAAPMRASAQDSSAESPDPTRLDVERLPPEAIEITRDMFARGFYLQAYVGSRGFFGALGKIANAGLFTRVGVGYELADFLMLGANFELSMHALRALPPPSEGNVQLMDALAELRLQWPISSRFALWLAGEGGIAWTRGNLLAVHGFQDANSVTLAYGGSLGFDWHLLSRHHSLGILAGTRLHPGLDSTEGAGKTYAFHSTAYLKYVF